MQPDDCEFYILGGGSQIAPFLSQRLGAIGAKGQVISRHAPPALPPHHPAFPWHALDLGNPGDWQPQPGAVILSTLPLWLLPPLLPRFSAARQIIAFSSTSRFAKADSIDPAERSLAAQLAEGEDRLIAACAAHGIPWTVLRPTLIYGSGRDHNISAVAQVIRQHGFFPIAHPGRGLRQPVHADDLSQAAVAAFNNPRAFYQSFNLPGGETLSYRDMVARVFQALGKKSRILPLPATLLRLALPLAQGRLPARYSPAVFLRMNQDLAFDGKPAEQALTYAPRNFQPRWDALHRVLQ